MRWALLAGAVVLGSTVASIRLFDASAQQFSPGGTGEAFPQDDPAIAPTPVGPHVMRGWMHGGLAGAARPGAEMLSLVYEAPDKQLTVADVQKIAEAFLLWHGNHLWRVTNVTADGDRVTFAVATDQNAVVATFAMNRHTGALLRLG